MGKGRAAAEGVAGLNLTAGDAWGLGSFWTLVGDRSKALHFPRRAVELDLEHSRSGIEQILEDPDFTSIRDDPEFKSILAASESPSRSE